MLAELQEILNSVLGRSDIEISMKTKLKDLPFASFCVVQFVCALEDKYDIEISNAEMKKFNTIKDVIKFLEKKTKK